MVHGVIIRIASTAERRPAVSADTAPRTTVRTPTLPAHGANIAIHSTDVQKPVRPVARLPMIMQITAIPTVRGRKPMIRSTSARKPAPLAAIPVMSMPTIPIRMATANVTPAAQPFR